VRLPKQNRRKPESDLVLLRSFHIPDEEQCDCAVLDLLDITVSGADSDLCSCPKSPRLSATSKTFAASLLE